MTSRAPDTVFIRGLEFEANHGYTAAERKLTRRFRVNLELQLELAEAALSDRIGDTVDYRKICDLAVSIGTENTFRLLEALAGNKSPFVRTPKFGIEDKAGSAKGKK